MKFHTPIIFLFAFLLVKNVNSQSRTQVSINDNWKYMQGGVAYAELPKSDDSKWQTVSLPHTWNAFDPFDDDKTYYRGISWYRKTLVLDEYQISKKLFVVFEGASQVADVFVNGAFVTRHIGGYTSFTADITPYVKKGNNIIAVQVNNAHDPYIAPLSIGYATYGGIYRDVWLVATDQLHFSGVNTNASGVFISTPTVSKQQATVAIKTTIVNDGDKQRVFEFVNTIYDADGRQVSSLSGKYNVGAAQATSINLTSGQITNPRLWSPDDPYLYTVKSQIIADGKVVDEVVNPLGFRWFSFDANNGFSLNGSKLVLNGTNRHQDMMGKGDALTHADHERDMRLIKEMGCNFVRLAHYPQTSEVLRLADKLGLLVWEETPVLNYITERPEFLVNSQNMLREMITQGYNHPSVIIWGSSNEILLYSKEGARIQKHTDTVYMNALRTMQQKLDSTVRAEDPTRTSTMAMHGSDDYYKYRLDIIPQLSSFNIYNGWYSGKLQDFGEDLDKYHARQPKQVLFVSEYGAEGEIKLGTEKPVRMDYTTQYQRLYHESYLRQIRQRPYLAGTAIWNEIDFSQPNIGGPTPHRNQKGMITWDRKPKDVYYMYKANWNLSPMVYIATRDWLNRAGEQGALSTIDVYSNGTQVSLTVNGKQLQSLQPDDVKKCSWKVSLRDGDNIVIASAKINGKVYQDNVIIKYNVYNANLASTPFKNISINVGSNAQYAEPSGNVWIEDKSYQPGSYGYTSGVPQMFGRGEVIKNTDDEPMFYTYLDSVQGYRIDVPDGEYKITLCFAEPKYTEVGQRVFDVAINHERVIADMDMINEAGFAQAFKKTFLINATNGKGIQIAFNATKGGALLSGLQVQQ